MVCRYGFRIVGLIDESRRLVIADAALVAYCSRDMRTEVDREAYLSAFTFPAEMGDHIDKDGSGSPKGYDGPCGSPYLWFDIDREENLDCALADTRLLVAAIKTRYSLNDDDFLVFYSGSKGFHVGLPTALWMPEPSLLFNKIARRLAQRLAEIAGVKIDNSVYDKVRPFRAPNSRHPKTGLYKRRLSLDELTGYSLEQIQELARQPKPFNQPESVAVNEQAVADWRDAMQPVEQESTAHFERRASNGSPTLNRLTLDFIREGAIEQERNQRLFSAAANLAEFACPPDLAHALLSESALDSGLSPSETRQTIENGLNNSRKGSGQ